MKRKNIMMISLLLAGAIVLLALSGSDTDTETVYKIGESGTWTDGTYTETAAGKNGSFEVTVIIRDGMISSIDVGENKETADRGGVAIEQLPDKMLEAQSYEVDAVSGATVTSNGLKNAVAKCLEKASE